MLLMELLLDMKIKTNWSNMLSEYTTAIVSRK